MGFKEKGDKLYEEIYDVVRRKSAILRRIREFKKKTAGGVLTADQKKAVKAFYAPYKIPNLVFHAYFTEKTGEFHENYIPIDLYVGYIDPYFNNIKEAKYLDNKCYYGALFHGIPQPEILAKRVNGMWMSGSDTFIGEEALEKIVAAEDGVFLKEAQTSAGGFGVTFFPGGKACVADIKAAAREIPTDLLLQRRIEQHDAMAVFNPSSVNTLRLYSLLGKDGSVKIYSAVMRLGIGDTKVDNYASGGLSVGITEDGRLKRDGYNKKGASVQTHPTSGLTFENYQLPSYDQVVAMVKRAHPMIPHFRSVSWDIAITKDGTPLLIEANLCRGGADLLQLNNGPLFGADTKKVLDEVFGK